MPKAMSHHSSGNYAKRKGVTALIMSAYLEWACDRNSLG
jgi:hypothetical protein